MEEIVLQASRRTVVGKQVNALRREGKLPAVLYGRYIAAIPLTLDLKEASQILQGVSPTTLIKIQVEGGDEYPVLVRERQRDPLMSSLRHVDFQAVSLTERVRANIFIHVVGVSPAVKNDGGILVTNMEELEIEGLPTDLPDRIEVDLSSLKEIGDIIHVRDLSIAPGVIVHADPNEIILVVTAPEAEVSEEELAEEGPEPELVERKRREEVED